MAAALKENAVRIMTYLQEHDEEDITATDIAEALQLEIKSVNGTITALDRHRKFVEREEVAITGGKVKYIRLTDAGRNFDAEANLAE